MVVSLRIFFESLFSYFKKLIAVKETTSQGSVHDFEIRLLTGETIALSKFKGSKMLIVNTASRCAYTTQYAALEKLHKDYYPKLIVIGFPANDFFWQEPGSNGEIADFCTRNYGVTFPMSEKVSVKGSHAHPLFQLLKAQTGHSPIWNFCKYLVDENGKAIAYFHTKVEPSDLRIVVKI